MTGHRGRLTGHFTLPDQAWWDDFRAPMEARTGGPRSRYAGGLEALETLDRLAGEPAMHRERSDRYAYEFFVVHKPD